MSNVGDLMVRNGSGRVRYNAKAQPEPERFCIGRDGVHLLRNSGLDRRDPLLRGVLTMHPDIGIAIAMFVFGAALAVMVGWVF